MRSTIRDSARVLGNAESRVEHRCETTSEHPNRSQRSLASNEQCHSIQQGNQANYGLPRIYHPLLRGRVGVRSWFVASRTDSVGRRSPVPFAIGDSPRERSSR